MSAQSPYYFKCILLGTEIAPLTTQSKTFVHQYHPTKCFFCKIQFITCGKYCGMWMAQPITFKWISFLSQHAWKLVCNGITPCLHARSCIGQLSSMWNLRYYKCVCKSTPCLRIWIGNGRCHLNKQTIIIISYMRDWGRASYHYLNKQTVIDIIISYMRASYLILKHVKSSAVVDTRFVYIYVDTKNIPTCGYNIQHFDRKTMEK